MSVRPFPWSESLKVHGKAAEYPPSNFTATRSGGHSVLLGTFGLGFAQWSWTPTFRGFSHFFGSLTGQVDGSGSQGTTYYQTPAAQAGESLTPGQLVAVRGIDVWRSVGTQCGAGCATPQTPPPLDEVESANHGGGRPTFVEQLRREVVSVVHDAPADARLRLTLSLPTSALPPPLSLSHRNAVLQGDAIELVSSLVNTTLAALADRGWLDDTAVLLLSSSAGVSDSVSPEAPLRVLAQLALPASLNSASLVYPHLMAMVDWLPTLRDMMGDDGAGAGEVSGSGCEDGGDDELCLDDSGANVGLSHWPALRALLTSPAATVQPTRRSLLHHISSVNGTAIMSIGDVLVSHSDHDGSAVCDGWTARSTVDGSTEPLSDDRCVSLTAALAQANASVLADLAAIRQAEELRLMGDHAVPEGMLPPLSLPSLHGGVWTPWRPASWAPSEDERARDDGHVTVDPTGSSADQSLAVRATLVVGVCIGLLVTVLLVRLVWTAWLQHTQRHLQQ